MCSSYKPKLGTCKDERFPRNTQYRGYIPKYTLDCSSIKVKNPAYIMGFDKDTQQQSTLDTIVKYDTGEVYDETDPFSSREIVPGFDSEKGLPFIENNFIKGPVYGISNRYIDYLNLNMKIYSPTLSSVNIKYGENIFKCKKYRCI